MIRLRRNFRCAILAIAILAVTIAAGCRDDASSPTVPTPAPTSVDEGPDPQDSLERALGFLQRLDEFEPSQVEGQIIYNLNRWIAAVEPDPEWKASPLIDDLPAELREHSALTSIRDATFQLSDMAALKETLWMREISTRVAEDESRSALVIWPTKDETKTNARTEQLLREAERLFDWTICNVQLDPLLDMPSATTNESLRTDVLPSRQTAPGPGYVFQPWQVILYGHGDVWQRARVFIQLARQQGIDVVMLALPQGADGGLRPWLPAVLIDGQLYLFDAELGLPLPGAGGKGIATLEEARSQPDILKSLAVGEALPYRVSSDDLKEVVALIDATPQALSRRMATLEGRLTGENQLALTIRPADLADKLRGIDGIARVQLWDVPIEADMFRSAVQRRLSRDDQFLAFYMQQFGLYEGLHPLVQARLRYFRGEFENQDERLGATGMYMECRMPDETIRDIATSPAAQQRMGLSREYMRPEVFQAQLQAAQFIAMQSKANSTYFMGFVHYELGNYRVAADWFQRSQALYTKGGQWSAHTDYNLARSYEALDRWEDARRLYLQSESPQQHGNLLRARMIAQQHPSE